MKKFVANPEIMVLMQDPKMQDIMKKVRLEAYSTWIADTSVPSEPF